MGKLAITDVASQLGLRAAYTKLATDWAKNAIVSDLYQIQLTALAKVPSKGSKANDQDDVPMQCAVCQQGAKTRLMREDFLFQDYYGGDENPDQKRRVRNPKGILQLLY